MNAESEQLDFVTIDGLLSYGEAMAKRPPVEGAKLTKSSCSLSALHGPEHRSGRGPIRSLSSESLFTTERKNISIT